MTDRAPLPSGDPPPSDEAFAEAIGTLRNWRDVGLPISGPIGPGLTHAINTLERSRASLSSGSPGTPEKRVAELRETVESERHRSACGCRECVEGDGKFTAALDELCSLASSGSRRESSDADEKQLRAAVAVAIYDAMRDHDPEGKHRPWTPGGNSIKQDEARKRADAAIDSLRASSSRTASPQTTCDHLWIAGPPPQTTGQRQAFECTKCHAVRSEAV